MPAGTRALAGLLLVATVGGCITGRPTAPGNDRRAMSGTNMTKAKMRGEGVMAGVRRIVFTGDSLTDGSAWCDWVVETLRANGHPKLVMHNAGVAGNSTAMLKRRYAKDVLALKPDMVVLNIGAADYRRAKLEDYQRDLEEMVRDTRKSGARVVLAVPPALRDPKANAGMHPYNDAARNLAEKYDCILVDFHLAFEEGAAAGKEMWGPDGVHHKIAGWQTMARCVLDALGCTAAMIEKTTLYPGSLTDWFISPPVPWKPAPVTKQWTIMPADFDPVAAGKGEYPPLPKIVQGFDPIAAGWRKFDREAEIKKTSWWQRCWLESGGVMPMGQECVKERPGAASRDAGAFGLAIVKADQETPTTMHVGGSFPYAVWLNGKLVWNGSFLHGYHPDADRFPVTLRQGENHILVFTNWLFYISLGEI